jgi:hypothetical protein
MSKQIINRDEIILITVGKCGGCVVEQLCIALQDFRVEELEQAYRAMRASAYPDEPIPNPGEVYTNTDIIDWMIETKVVKLIEYRELYLGNPHDGVSFCAGKFNELLEI